VSIVNKRTFQTGTTVDHRISNMMVIRRIDGKKLASGSFDKTVVTFVLERDRLVRAYVDALPSSRMRLT
jgi:hypothetical protein